MLGTIVFQAAPESAGAFSKFDLVAVYAAIVATAAFALEVIRWWTSGVRLNVRLMSHAMMFGAPNVDSKEEWLSVTIVNNGDRAAIVGGLTMQEFTLFRRIVRRWFHHRRMGMVLLDAAFMHQHAGLPVRIEPGNQWTGCIQWKIVQDALDKAEGRLYLGIQTSDRKWERLVRIKSQ